MATLALDASGDLSSHPHCPHGPCVLFRRSAGDSRAFFSCSAARDRRDCPFFLWQDEAETKNGMKTAQKWVQRAREHVQDEEAKIAKRQSALGAAVDKAKGRFCQDCQEVFVNGGHGGHEVKKVRLKEMTPRLLSQLSQDKKEAQYHFTGRTLETLAGVLEGNGLDKVLCVGAPRVAEHLRKNKKSFLLLDIDSRLSSFFKSGSEWIWYNMFNHHFFLGDGESGKESYEKFLKSSGNGLAVFLDPPFGGKCELISATLGKISRDWRVANGLENGDPKFFWVFPYFMEGKITSQMPSLVMSDYQVNYENHKSFQDGGRKQGSPVRVFTNLDLTLVDLSAEKDSYKYCDECLIWVHRTNSHCSECGRCTAKSGARYRHCAACARCVKETWRHCAKCGRCALPQHPCEKFRKSQKRKD